MDETKDQTTRVPDCPAQSLTAVVKYRVTEWDRDVRGLLVASSSLKLMTWTLWCGSVHDYGACGAAPPLERRRVGYVVDVTNKELPTAATVDDPTIRRSGGYRVDVVDDSRGVGWRRGWVSCGGGCWVVPDGRACGEGDRG
jgi:hypothetical protein